MSSRVIRRATRSIQVWVTGVVCVEREGKTLSIQVKFPDGTKAAMILPHDAACDLASILPDATAIPGTVVGEDDETDIVRRDAHGRTGGFVD